MIISHYIDNETALPPGGLLKSKNQPLQQAAKLILRKIQEKKKFKSRAKNLKELKHAWDKAVLPNTQKSPIDIDLHLEPDLEDKLDDKVSQLSRQFGVPQSKVRQIILSLVDQALETEEQEKSELPY